MTTYDRRLVLQERFELVIEKVVGAFLAEGFTVRPVDGGDLHHCATACDSLRFAVLETSLPELSSVAIGSRAVKPAILTCRIALFEMIGDCTLLTAASPVAEYPLLAAVVPRLYERVGRALRTVMQRGASAAA